MGEFDDQEHRHSPQGAPHWRQSFSAKQERLAGRGSKTARDKTKWRRFIICPPKTVYTGLSRGIWRPPFRLIRETESFFKRSIRVGARSNKSETFPSRWNSARAI